MQLGELVEKMTPSDRLIINNASNQAIYRGFVANFIHSNIDPVRQIKCIGLGMEIYRGTEVLWDWKNIEKLPEQIPVEQLGQYDIGKLQQLLFIRVTLNE